MKSFWKNVSSYIGYSEEKPVRSCHAQQPRAESPPSELDVSMKIANLAACRSNRPALGRGNPAATVLRDELINQDPSDTAGAPFHFVERRSPSSSTTSSAPATGEFLLERPSSARAAGPSSLTENPTNGIGTAFSDADSGHNARDFLNSRCGKLKRDNGRDEPMLRNPKIGSFESLVGGIQDAPVPGGRGTGRGSPGSLLSQNSPVFLPQKRMNSVKYSDTLQLNCTEGLGFESSDEREDSVSLGSDHSPASSPRLHVQPGNNNNNTNNGEADGDRPREHHPYGSQAVPTSDDHSVDEEHRSTGIQRCNTNPAFAAGLPKRPSRAMGSFPPPLPSIARNGQPWITLRSFRTDGRFVLQEVKAPPHEILHAWRQDGRLKLQLVHHEDEVSSPPPDDGAGNDDGDDFGDGEGDGDESANPVEKEKTIAEVADVEIDGSEAATEILH